MTTVNGASSGTGSTRPHTTAPASPAWIASSPAPSTRAAVSAASALYTLNAPGMPTAYRAPSTVNAAPSRPPARVSAKSASARTSAGQPMP